MAFLARLDVKQDDDIAVGLCRSGDALDCQSHPAVHQGVILAVPVYLEGHVMRVCAAAKSWTLQQNFWGCGERNDQPKWH